MYTSPLLNMGKRIVISFILLPNRKGYFSMSPPEGFGTYCLGMDPIGDSVGKSIMRGGHFFLYFISFPSDTSYMYRYSVYHKLVKAVALYSLLTAFG